MHWHSKMTESDHNRVQRYLVDADSCNGTYANVGLIELSCDWGCIVRTESGEPEPLPTHLDVMAETLNIAQRVAEECDEPFIVVDYDLAIAKPALQLQATESPKYNNIFIAVSHHHDLYCCSWTPHRWLWWSWDPHRVWCSSTGFPEQFLGW